MLWHGVYVNEKNSQEMGDTAGSGIANIIFDPETSSLRIVLDDGREFFTGSLKGDKGDQGDGYNPEVIQGLKDYADDAVFQSEMDDQAAFALLLNAFRQHVWDEPVYEEGTVTLTNTLEFPFNNSVDTVALTNRQINTSYLVICEVTSAVGNPGEIVISERQVNGFKIAYTGSASSAVVHYTVIGGYIK